jgi:TPR repeat protein
MGTTSAEQGDSPSQNNLGYMYSEGQGVVQDYKEAVKWFRKSAEQGNAKSQHNLGGMYENGQGVLQDYVMAHMYLSIASVSGRKGAKHNRDNRGILEKKMTTSQLEKAQDLAREWMRKHQ